MSAGTVQPGGVYEPDPYWEVEPAAGSPWVFIGAMALFLVFYAVGKVLESNDVRPPPWSVVAWVCWIAALAIWF